MRFENPSDSVRKQILEQTQTIAVVGLSSKPHRTSFMIAAALQNVGYKIIPVNPFEHEVLGEQAVASLSDIEESFDLVNVFRRSDKVFPVVREAVQLGVKSIWLQQGVFNLEAAEYAQQHGVTMIMDRCIKVDHSLLRVGRGN